MLSTPYKAEQRRMIRGDKRVSSSNWPDLPPDLLRVIYRKLYDTFDFINFRAVCKCWLAAAPLSEHPPQFPFLLEREAFRGSKFKLYSLLTGKTRRIQVPEVRNKVFCGQSQGYLVAYKTGDDDISPTLVNPFTRAEVPLPFQGFTFFMPLHVGADPIRNSDDVVIYMNLGIGCRFVGFWKNEENGWCLKGSFPGRVEVYNRGRLFFSNFTNYSTTIMDLTTGNKLEVRLPYNDFRRHDFYCLDEGAGAFLGIQRHFQYSCTKDEYLTLLEKCWFEVYQLVEEQSPPRWVKLSDIGNLIIFWNDDNTGFCLSASDFQGIKANCIYFTKRIHARRMLIGRYELGKHRPEVIGQLESQGTWIVPNVF